MTLDNSKRLNKFISESGFCSRREADRLIESKRVTINGIVPELGTKVLPGDSVFVDGKLVAASPENKSDRIYIAYNKPIGITCTTERHVRGNIIDAIGHKERIFPIGRLDKPSEGLIFLTSDGDIVNKILRAENAHDKEYIVTVDKPISERFLGRMARGVPILGTITKPCIVKVESKFVFRIVLTQGLNRQIRRMCEYLDYEVLALKRSRIMDVELGQLRPGQWRDLTVQEMVEINKAVANSRKTALESTVKQTSRNRPELSEMFDLEEKIPAEEIWKTTEEAPVMWGSSDEEKASNTQEPVPAPLARADSHNINTVTAAGLKKHTVKKAKTKGRGKLSLNK